MLIKNREPFLLQIKWGKNSQKRNRLSCSIRKAYWPEVRVVNYGNQVNGIPVDPWFS